MFYFSPYLYVTNVIAMYLYSLPQTSGTQIIFVYLRYLSGLSVVCIV